MRLGILALQGDFAAHANVLQLIGVDYQYINQADQLESIQGLIIPGGESTTMLKLLQASGLFALLKQRQLPIFGTCAGAILLAEKVISPEQISLSRIPMTIKRNAYGRQCESHISCGNFLVDNSDMEMVFIRAPRIREHLPDVQVIASYGKEPVAVRYGNCLAATFHPEITNDSRLHHYFIKHCLTN
jgi:5'-phosphate synthase pdxT subunit